MLRKIKIGFLEESFYTSFKKEDNWHLRFLKRFFDVDLSDNPDFIFFSEQRHYEHIAHCLPSSAIRIFITGENVRPDFTECDYALTHDCFYNQRHYRLPESRHWIGDWALKPRIAPEIMKSKTKFCNFVYSNPQAKERIDFFQLLNNYKQVDSGGNVLNNLGFLVEDKLDFINHYKFTIAFENSSFPGYSTEKIIQPLMKGSIPIYWGDPQVTKDYNPDCFINVNDYKSYQEVVEKIKQIDNDPNLWKKYLESPVFKNNIIPKHFEDKELLNFFENIFKHKCHQVPFLIKQKQLITYHLKNSQLYKKSTYYQNRIKRIFH